MCISNSGFCYKSKESAINKRHCKTESEVYFNPLLHIHKPLATIPNIRIPNYIENQVI